MKCFLYSSIFLFTCLVSSQSFARPVFARFVLEPVEAPKEELARDIEEQFLKSFKEKEFENLLSQTDQDLLRKNFINNPKEYKELIQETIDDGNIDLVFKVKITKENETKQKISFSMMNTKRKVLFVRQSIHDYLTSDEYLLRLQRWVKEFKDLLPPVGEIIKRGNGKIDIKIIHGSKLEDFRSRPFHVGGFNFASSIEDRNYEAMGALTNIKVKPYEGYVYNDFRGQNFGKGDYVIFLNKEQISDSIANTEDITISETWFNYLNSPNFSLLDCSLLPLFGTVPMLKELHQNMINVINREKLCKFRSDKDLSTMLKKYEGNLEEHLNNDDIMRNLARILRVGALFRLGIYQLASGVSIKFDVVGENGKTVFFSRYTVIEEFDDEYITELLLGWILAYKKSLPLSGKVVQIRGKTLLIDIPSGLVEGSQKEFKVIRPKSFRYEDIGGNRKLTWKKDIIAYGEILRVKKLHSIGNVFKFEDKNNKVREGDWIFIDDLDFNIKEEWYLQKIHNLKNDRGIGRAKVSTEVTRVATKGNSETIVGVGLAFDLYLPAGFLFSGEVVRNISGGDQSISNNNLTAALGYSFTPRLYSDYFSFVDVYLGYRTLNYQIANFDEIGIGDLKYSGVFVGAKIEVPIYKKLSLQFQTNYIPVDSVENSNDLFGAAESSQAFDGLVTAKYKYDDSSRLFVEFHQRVHKTNFKSSTDNVDLGLNASLIKLGYGVDF